MPVWKRRKGFVRLRGTAAGGQDSPGGSSSARGAETLPAPCLCVAWGGTAAGSGDSGVTWAEVLQGCANHSSLCSSLSLCFG